MAEQHQKNFRIDGVYPQRQTGFFMQRVKLPAGVISAEQARTVADIAARFAHGQVHLSTRGSIEFHWLREEELPVVAHLLATVGLTTRGACGGAVRGVTCGSLGVAGSPRLEALVRRLHRHFTGNPRFEALPKKFKIGVESDSRSGRHLVQDVGLVASPDGGRRDLFDVWVAGGLGREPQPGFLLAESVAEERLILLIETILRLYAAQAPAGKRLKHLVREIGRDEFRRRVLDDPAAHEELPVAGGLAAHLLPPAATPGQRLEARIFAGELSADSLTALADFAHEWASGILVVTDDQDIAFHLAAESDPAAARERLAHLGFSGASRDEQVICRVCPGSHECLMGLAPTRDVAQKVLQQLGAAGAKLTWAIAGCPNSCSRPQLADAGIVATRSVAEEGGERQPRFDLYRAGSDAFAAPLARDLSLDGLLTAVGQFG